MPTPFTGITYDLTVGGVSCCELHEDTGRESFDFTPGNIAHQSQRKFVMDWGSRGTFINALKITAHPSFSYLWALQFQVEPHRKSNGTYSFEEALVTVIYKNLPYNTTDFKEVQVETSCENVAKDQDGMEFDTGSTPIDKKCDFDPQVFVATTTYKVIYHNQTSINEALWSGYVNKVNNASYHVASGFRNWPLHTLLYAGYSINQKVASDGIHYEVTHTFVGVEGKTHNQEWNPKTGDWDKVKAKTTGDFKYDEADFTGLGV